MNTDPTTDPPTLADELRRVADECLETTPHYDEERAVVARVADVLDVLAPEVLALAGRMRADLEAHPLPDGWTPVVWSHSGVVVRPADYPHRPSIYVGSIAADDYAWSFQLRDEEPWTTAATLADVVTAYLAAGR